MDPTDIRLERTITLVGQALRTARERVGQFVVTSHRTVYQVLQLHQFNLRMPVFGPGNKGLAEAWTVPETWTTGGSDCYSGAMFAAFAANMAGIPGSITVAALAAKSSTEPTTAVDFVGSDPNRRTSVVDQTTG